MRRRSRRQFPRPWPALLAAASIGAALWMPALAVPAVAVDPLPTYVGNLAAPGLADMYPVDVTRSGVYYYVLDPGRYRVVAVNRTTGAIDFQVGGHQGRKNGQFGAARAIAHDSAGNIYVADTSSNRVQKFDANLNFVRKWGSKGPDPGQFSQDYGIAAGWGKGADGNPAEVVYVTDGTPGRVQKFTLDGTYISTFGAGYLSKPRQLAINPATKDVYVVSAGTKSVAVFSPNGDFKFDFGGPGTGPGKFLEDPRGISITADQYVYVTDPGNYRVQVFDADGTFLCAFGTKGTGPGQFVEPRGLTVTGDAKILVTDEWDFALKEWEETDVATCSFTYLRKLFGGSPPVGGFNSPRGIDVNPTTGQIYGVDWWNQRIQRFDADGSSPLAWGFRGPKATLGTLNFPWDVAVEPSTGRVFVANRESNEIKVFDANGNQLTRWGRQGTGTSPPQFKFPQGLAFAPGGTLLVADSSNHRIQRFSIDPATGRGTFLASYGGFGTGPGQFNVPTGIDVAPDGTIWVADTMNSRIQKRDPQSGVWTVYTVPAGGTTFKLPWGVTVAPDGAIWVADSGNDRIVKMTSGGAQLFAAKGTDLGAGPLDAPFAVAFGSTGLVYVSDVWNNRIIELR